MNNLARKEKALNSLKHEITVTRAMYYDAVHRAEELEREIRQLKRRDS